MNGQRLTRHADRDLQLGSDEHGLLIRNGRVFCPLRGAVDLAVCWRCPAYRGLTAGSVERLVCSADIVAGGSSATAAAT
jgi:hypothetical protein